MFVSTRRAFFFLANVLNFIITEYLKQVDDDLSIYLDEHSTCVPSVTEDIKIYQCYLIKFDNSSSSVTREICQSHVIMR